MKSYTVTLTHAVNETYVIVAPSPESAAREAMDSEHASWYKNTVITPGDITCLTVEDSDGDIVHREGFVSVPLKF